MLSAVIVTTSCNQLPGSQRRITPHATKVSCTGVDAPTRSVELAMSSGGGQRSW